MRGWSCGGQKPNAKQEKFCEVFALKFASFVHKIVQHYLPIVQVHLSFAAPNVYCGLPISERK